MKFESKARVYAIVKDEFRSVTMADTTFLNSVWYDQAKMLEGIAVAVAPKGDGFIEVRITVEVIAHGKGKPDQDQTSNHP